MGTNTLLADAEHSVAAPVIEGERATAAATVTQPAVPAVESNVEYHDMRMLSFINNSIVADLIRLVRSALKQGKELRFINVPATLKAMLSKLGLNEIIKCS